MKGTQWKNATRNEWVKIISVEGSYLTYEILQNDCDNPKKEFTNTIARFKRNYIKK
jgi:hypothetical protein